MPCTDGVRPMLGLRAALLALVLTLTGCAGRPALQAVPMAPAPAAVSSADPVIAQPSRAEPVTAISARPGDAGGKAPAKAQAPAPSPAAAQARAPPRYVQLGPPKTPRTWDELRLQAAQRLVAAHPDTSYVGKPPSILLAIPILEVELNADGSVRQIKVLRVPGQAQDTTELAIAAVRRAAPYGDVSRLSKPWKFVQTFLFDDERRFMPRLLDP